LLSCLYASRGGDEIGNGWLPALVKFDARQGGGDFRGTRQRCCQGLRVLRHGWVEDFQAAHFLDFDARVRGDVNAVTSLGAADGGDDLRDHFGHDQTLEIPRTKCFVEKQPGLNRAEAEADEG